MFDDDIVMYVCPLQWACESDMDKKYAFGTVSINCEGYDSHTDLFVLTGSCRVRDTQYVIRHMCHIM